MKHLPLRACGYAVAFVVAVLLLYAGAQTVMERAAIAAERLEKENAQLKTILADREDQIVKLSTKLKETTDLAMTLDRDLTFSQERNAILDRWNQEHTEPLTPAPDKTPLVS